MKQLMITVIISMAALLSIGYAELPRKENAFDTTEFQTNCNSPLEGPNCSIWEDTLSTPDQDSIYKQQLLEETATEIIYYTFLLILLAIL